MCPNRTIRNYNLNMRRIKRVIAIWLPNWTWVLQTGSIFHWNKLWAIRFHPSFCFCGYRRGGNGDSTWSSGSFAHGAKFSFFIPLLLISHFLSCLAWYSREAIDISRVQKHQREIGNKLLDSLCAHAALPN